MRRILLFRLVWKDGKRRHDVELWRNYGVVCPDLCTTNGSPRQLADFIWSHMQAGKYAIEAVPEVGDPDASSEIALRDWLTSAMTRLGVEQ